MNSNVTHEPMLELNVMHPRAQRFLDRINSSVIVCDGAMGTMLYGKGIFINRCFDELNVSMPALIKEIHQAYVKAGAEILETNTFGANSFRLSAHGLVEKLRDINIAGVKLARQCAGEDILVGGAVGPLGVRIEPLGPTSFAEARQAFKEQIEALAEGGADILMLETFGDLHEIREAILAAREVCDLPLVAQMTVDDDGNALYGGTAEALAEQLTEWGADVVGLNCSVGPKTMLESVERMMRKTTKPLAVQPNAGNPVNIEGRNVYLCSPEYLCQYARRYIQAGVKLIGGCCGTTPEHIKLLKNEVRSLQPAMSRAAIKVDDSEKAKTLPVIPFETRSNLAMKLKNKEFPVFVEILPPRGSDPRKEIEGAKYCADHGVDCINIPDGPRASARMSAQALAFLVQQQTKIEAVLHYCCRDRNVISMQSDLLGVYALGIRNLILITGDPPRLGNYPDATAVFDVDAIGLTNIVANLNKGLDLGGNGIGSQTGFCIGVGANPGAVNMDQELRRTYWKVEAGAEYIVTQPVFDLDQIEQFLKRIEGFRVPVIAGIWPLTSYRNAEFMVNELRVPVPAALMERMRKADSGDAARAEGTAIAQEMVAQIRNVVDGVQLSAPFGRYGMAVEVMEALGTRGHAA
jgi:methionine synthase I (cobalamin-dependent)/5,10-methylenetetrahydrofolate reductase